MKREEFKKQFKEIFELRIEEFEAVNERDYQRFKYLRKKADEKMAALGKRFGVKIYEEDLDTSIKKFMRHAKETFGDDIEDEMVEDIEDETIDKVEELLSDEDFLMLAYGYTMKYYKGL